MNEPEKAPDLVDPSPLPVSGPERRRCQHVHQDGRGCGAYPLRDSELCSAHDPRPEIVQRRKDALRKGGKTQLRAGLDGWKEIKIDAIEDLKARLAQGSIYIEKTVIDSKERLPGYY